MPFIPFPSRFNAMVSPARADPPFPVDRLPDDVLALVLRSLAQTSFRHALVSKRWYRLATSALSHLTIRHRDLSMQEVRDSEHFRNAQLAWLPLPRLLSVLRRFPTLTHVSLSEFSIVSADGDALFQCLAATCPLLSILTVEHQFRMVVTVDGLASLFHGCRKLREFRLLTTFCLPHLPPSPFAPHGSPKPSTCALILSMAMTRYRSSFRRPRSIGALAAAAGVADISAGNEFPGLGDILPESICFLPLSSLSISSCSSLTSLPHHIGALSHLQTLSSSTLIISGICPKSLGKLPRLQSLGLDLPALRASARGDYVKSSLPACLEKLRLTNCEQLRELPHSLYKLTRLQSLHIDSCSRIESVKSLTPPISF
ncbi:unnamed protein product [Closterium sp. NIES-64]|nr:unnamed protein product [Closterium sp. NIES-64]